MIKKGWERWRGRIVGDTFDYMPSSHCTAHPAVPPPPWGYSVNEHMGKFVKVNCGNPNITLALCPRVMTSYPLPAQGLMKQRWILRPCTAPNFTFTLLVRQKLDQSIILVIPICISSMIFSVWQHHPSMRSVTVWQIKELWSFSEWK